MKKLLILGVLALTSADLSAREPLLVPTSGQLAMAPEPTLIDAVPVEQGIPVAYSQYIVQQPVQVIQLYQNVRVRDLQNVHPNAVRKIISVPNPRDKCSRVNIEICVPPFANENVRCFRNGDRLRFCYGSHSVDVISRRRDVVVNYND